MKETHQDVLALAKNDTPENREAFAEKYGAFATKVLTTTLLESIDPSSRISKSARSKLVTLISTYADPTMIDPLIRAFKLHAEHKTALLNTICKHDDKRATKFLITLMDSSANREMAKRYFAKYPHHVERLKSLKPELVDDVLASDPIATPEKLKCYKCGRSEDDIKIIQCPSCGRPFCVDHNYYGGYCSITCAK